MLAHHSFTILSFLISLESLESNWTKPNSKHQKYKNRKKEIEFLFNLYPFSLSLSSTKPTHSSSIPFSYHIYTLITYKKDIVQLGSLSKNYKILLLFESSHHSYILSSYSGDDDEREVYSEASTVEGWLELMCVWERRQNNACLLCVYWHDLLILTEIMLTLIYRI